MKTLRKVIWLLVLVGGLVACKHNKEQKTGVVVIEGNVPESYNNKTVKLSSTANRQLVVLDQDTVSDGHFVLALDSTEIKEPMVVLLQPDGGMDRLFLMVEPHTKVKVTVKDKFMNAIVESDSPATKGFAAYMDLFQKYRDEEMKLQNAWRQAANDKQKQSQIEADYEALQEKKEQEKYALAEKNAGNVAGALILGDLLSNPNADVNKLKALYDKLSPEVKKTAYAVQAKTDLETKMKTAVGAKAPDFEAPTPDGKTLRMSDVLKKSKVLVLDFWASWCRPCRVENPYVVDIYKKYHDKGLNILSVSLDRPGQKDKWLEAIKKDGLDWYHVSNLQYWQDTIARLYGVRSIPATFILDKNGVIRAKNLRREKLEAKIKELLNE